jgi:hypothetical protein
MAKHLGRGTRWPGQTVEHQWRKGSGTEEDEGSGNGLAPMEVTGGSARGGAKGGEQDLASMDLPGQQSHRRGGATGGGL